MGNNYFRFKQFTIDQAGCAMKVTTDASLFGAWVAMHAKQSKQAVDIGGGTGLLSLMLAQKNETAIDTIEIEQKCFDQMMQNIQNSEWRERIRCVLQDVNNIDSTDKYDIILSNPPFHQHQLKSNQHTINLARHGDDLTLEALFKKVSEMIAEDGEFFLLIPSYRELEAASIAEKTGMCVRKKALVKQSVYHDGFRVMYSFSKKNISEVQTEEISIKDSKDHYTLEFIEYLKDYYLFL
jgi:tRNA1Val (adenine37-N6)-methyltransferase